MTEIKHVIVPESLSSWDAATAGERLLPLQLTPQAIDDFEACAFRFARTYVERLPQPEPRPPAAAVVDRVVHRAIGEFFREGGWQAINEKRFHRILETILPAARGNAPRISATNSEAAREMLLRFYQTPYPAGKVRELGTERLLTWRRFRKGILASVVADRVCLLPDGFIEVIDYRGVQRRPSARAIADDTTALFLRSIVADAYKDTMATGIRITVAPLRSAKPVTILFDKATFDRGWVRIQAAATGIREGFHRVLAGEPVASAFPPSPGTQCHVCPLKRSCERLRAVESAA